MISQIRFKRIQSTFYYLKMGNYYTAAIVTVRKPQQPGGQEMASRRGTKKKMRRKTDFGVS